MIRVKRIYERREESDGYRVLVDRLWPRGVRKRGSELGRLGERAGTVNRIAVKPHCGKSSFRVESRRWRLSSEARGIHLVKAKHLCRETA